LVLMVVAALVAQWVRQAHFAQSGKTATMDDSRTRRSFIQHQGEIVDDRQFQHLAS
jgi:hypothetical protein